MRRKGPQTGTRVKFRCAACSTLLCTFYEYPPDSGEIYPLMDRRIKTAQRVSPDSVPFPEAVVVFTCPRGSCQRSHLLHGSTVRDAFLAAKRRNADDCALPAADPEG